MTWSLRRLAERPGQDGIDFMGQKVRPTGFRTGIMTDWLSTWYANKQDFAELLVEDFKIRRFVKKKYGGAGSFRLRLERTREKGVIYIHSAPGRPSIVLKKHPKA